MSVHDARGNGPAHVPSVAPGSRRMTFLNIDKTGVSMSGKTALSLIAFIIFLVSGWFAFISANAMESDLAEHNESNQAHEIVVEEGAEPMPLSKVVKEHHKVIKMVAKNTEVIVSVKNGFYEDRAERLADRAADKIEDASRSRERWKQVKQKAMRNLEAKKPIREGLEDFL